MRHQTTLAEGVGGPDPLAERPPASHNSPEVLGSRQGPGLEARPCEERCFLMKRGHGEAAPGYSLWVLGLRVIAEVAEDAGDGQGDHKEHGHHSDHCRLHGFRVGGL